MKYTVCDCHLKCSLLIDRSCQERTEVNNVNLDMRLHSLNNDELEMRPHFFSLSSTNTVGFTFVLLVTKAIVLSRINPAKCKDMQT